MGIPDDDWVGSLELVIFFFGEKGKKRETDMMYLVHKWSKNLGWASRIR